MLDINAELDYLRDRITELRIQKHASERGMSLDLGHGTSYIHNICDGSVLPSVTELFYICDYFGISIQDFFRNDNESLKIQVITNNLRYLSDDDLNALEHITEKMKEQTK